MSFAENGFYKFFTSNTTDLLIQLTSYSLDDRELNNVAETIGRVRAKFVYYFIDKSDVSGFHN